MSETEDVRVRIALPLPLDVAGTITALISAAYPNSTLDTRGAGYELVAVIPDGDRRPKRVGKRAVAELKDTTDDPDNTPSLVRWGEDGMPRFSSPEHAQLAIAYACAMLLAPVEIVNYLGWEVSTTDNQRFYVAACRSEGQTPHALREHAEQQRDALRAALERLVALKDGPRDDEYRAGKDAAWQSARDLLTEAQ
jgi:hypothetical protein